MSRRSFFLAAPRSHRRAAWATGLSLVLHALALSGMVLGVKVLKPPPEDRAIALRLIPQSEFRPPPESDRRRPERSAVVPRPRPAPQPAPEASATAPAETPASSAEADQGVASDVGPRVFSPSLSGRLGCDDSLGVRLTSAQRQVCADNMARLGREAKPFALDIPEPKQAAYDLHVRCFRDWTTRPGIPPMTEYNADGTPVRGVAAGLGVVPKGCLGWGK